MSISRRAPIDKSILDNADPEVRLRAPCIQPLDKRMQEWPTLFREKLEQASTSSHKIGTEFASLDEIGKIDKEIEVLETRIETEYESGCFDYMYKELIDQCCQIQQRLDRIDVAGNTENENRKRNGILRAEEAAQKLNSKTHANGKPCHKCK